MGEPGHAGAEDVLAALGRHWGPVLVFGILALVGGVLVLVWPHISLLLAAVILGILSLIVGIYLLRRPFSTVAIIGFMLGLYWIVTGVIDLFTAIADRELSQRWAAAVLGVLTVVAGIIILANPVTALLFLALILGIWLILLGLITIVRAFRMMRGARTRVPEPARAI